MSIKIQSEIKLDLLKVGAIDERRIECFSNRTRDNSSLKVYRDIGSKVIFIDDYYVGDQQYIKGEYRKEYDSDYLLKQDYEDVVDTKRRAEVYDKFIRGKYVCDFGCGKGSYIQLIADSASYVCGVELQSNYVECLNSKGFDVYPDLESVDKKIDVITLYHSFEHMSHPLATLEKIYKKLKSNGGGRIIVEVPHAKDFLINTLKHSSFINFTLWSQHLILHTRESLLLMLQSVGFKDVIIEGVQRYSVANHLNWLVKNAPGGHKSEFASIETAALIEAYASALMKIDASDTLVAIATA